MVGDRLVERVKPARRGRAGGERVVDVSPDVVQDRDDVFGELTVEGKVVEQRAVGQIYRPGPAVTGDTDRMPHLDGGAGGGKCDLVAYRKPAQVFGGQQSFGHGVVDDGQHGQVVHGR